MPSQRRGAVGRWGVCWMTLLASWMATACKPTYRTPAPPFRDVETASDADRRRYCNDAALRFDERGQTDTVAEALTQVGLVPEAGSQAISEDDLAHGRVLAKVRIVKGDSFADLGVRDSACWFAHGRLPDSVLSTFVSFDGRVLVTLPTETHREKHAKAEVRWYPSYGKQKEGSRSRSPLPVKLAAFIGSRPLSPGALAWSTCTSGYCCSPISRAK